MIRRLILFIALAGLFAPTVSLAQESQQPTTVAVEYWKCDYSKLGIIAQVTDSLVIPIAQELVNEGRLVSYGMLTHNWGDEWNVVFYQTAADKTAFFSAWTEINSRFNERHPDVPPLTDYCTEHKDNIYTLRAVTTPATQ